MSDTKGSLYESPTVLSLFAGIGGIDLGLESLGCRTIAYSEFDPYASSIMALRFPEADNLGDITQIDWSNVERPDIICGGFPCQDISLAGKGAGIDGDRSGLWRYYADAVRALRPSGVLVENVSALLGRGIDRVLGDLAACGFDAEWDCVPAASVGAPHRRDRVFIVAYREREKDSDPSTLQRTAIERAQQNRNHASSRVLADTNSRGRKERTQHDSQPLQSRQQAPLGHHVDGCRDDVADTDSARREESGGGKPVEAEQPTTQRRRTHEGRTLDDTNGRRHGAPEGQVPTRWDRPVQSDWWCVEPSVGRVAHGIPRRVDRLRCLGNAVVPQVAEHVGRILLDRIGR